MNDETPPELIEKAADLDAVLTVEEAKSLAKSRDIAREAMTYRRRLRDKERELAQVSDFLTAAIAAMEQK